MSSFTRSCCHLLTAAFISSLLLATPALAQDATGAIRGTVTDAGGGRIGAATVVLVNTATNFRYSTTTGVTGRFIFDLLPPGDYSGRVESPGMSPQTTPRLHVDVGGTTDLDFKLAIAGVKETVTVSGEPPLVETQPSGLSALIDERAINELPLNGRRYTDLALLTPGVTQDPRGLTSGSNGDLAATTTTHSSGRLAGAIARPISSPTKWCRSFAFPRTPTARNWGAPAARW